MKRFRNILCVVELGGICEPVLERAVTLAENNQARLTVVDVAPHLAANIIMPKGGHTTAELQAEVVNTQRQQLETLVEPYTNRVKLETKVLVGTPFLEIIREILRNGRDLVIKLPERQNWQERLFGSDDMHLLRKCPCPVWLIQPRARNTYRRILAAVDVDNAYPQKELETRRALNHQVIELASSLALAESAELHIVHAWDAPGESAMRHSAFTKTSDESVDDWVEQVKQQHSDSMDAFMNEAADIVGQDALDYLEQQRHLMRGQPRDEIPALAKRIDADLIVMGTVARTGVLGFIMGNTAETILNRIDCSVLALKPPGFTSPVTLDE